MNVVNLRLVPAMFSLTCDFYIVALLFIIFDVEVAFFFPWATVFGKSEQLASLADAEQAVASGEVLTDDAQRLLLEMGVAEPCKQFPLKGRMRLLKC